MKKAIILAVAIVGTLLMVSPSYALFNGGDTTNNAGGDADASSLAAAGAIAAVGVDFAQEFSLVTAGIQGLKNETTTGVHIEGDEKFSTLAFSTTSPNPAQGSEGVQIGLTGLSYTIPNKLTKVEKKIYLYGQIGVQLTPSDIDVIKKEIDRATKQRKLFGIVPWTNENPILHFVVSIFLW